MKIQPYIEKLSSSQEYKSFESEHKDAFLAAGFFVLDLENKKNVHQIDYFVPSQNKVAAFTLDLEKPVQLQMLQMMNDKRPEPLSMETNLDLDALEGVLEDGMKNRNYSEKIKKIIAVIQTLEGKKVWSLNCILSGMELLRAHVDDDTKTILKMEKSSLMDIVKKVQPGALRQQQGPVTKGDVGAQIEKLNKLEKQIEAEKKRLEQDKDKVPT
jgi:hypothetical protein